jgi:hypothetical protein
MIQLGLSSISPSCVPVFAEWLHQKGLPQDILQVLTCLAVRQGSDVDKATEAVIEAVEANMATKEENIAKQRGKEEDGVDLLRVVL